MDHTLQNVGNDKHYPSTCQFFPQSELILANFLKIDHEQQPRSPNPTNESDMLRDLESLETLSLAHFLTVSFCEQLRLTDSRHLNNLKIPHVAMTILHICIKRIKTESATQQAMEQDGRPSQMKKCFAFDIKLLILSCIRISAVIHDIELKQDDFTKVYYDSVSKEA